MSEAVSIRRLSSGVPGLDEVLGGGIPELSLNLIVGGPGSGKTTLGQQIMFANASPERKALFFTIIGSLLKMLRYMQQYSFLIPRWGKTGHYSHLGRRPGGGVARSERITKKSMSLILRWSGVPFARQSEGRYVFSGK